MKNNLKKSVIIFVISFISIFCNIYDVYAIDANNTPNLDIEVESNKNEYQTGEPITYSIILENNTNYNAKDISMNVTLPDDAELLKGKTTYNSIQVKSKESQEFQLTIKYGNSKNIDIDISDGDTSDNNIKTGDHTQLGLYMGLGIVSIIIIILIIKRKKLKNISLVFIIFGMIFSNCILDNGVYAKEQEFLNIHNSKNIETIVNNENKLLKIDITSNFYSKGDSFITLDQSLNENGAYETDQEELTFSGKAEDLDGIEKLSYEINDYATNVIKGDVSGTSSWSFTDNFSVGYSTVCIRCEDKLGNITEFKFDVIRKSKEVKLSDNVVPLEEKEVSNFNENLVEIVKPNNGKQYLIFKEQASIIQKYKSGGIDIGNIIYISDNNVFPEGYTRSVSAVNNPSYFEDTKDLGYSDTDFEVIETIEPAFNEVFDDDVCLVDDEKSNMKLVFAETADGTDLITDTKARSQDNTKPNIKFENNSLDINLLKWILFDRDNNYETDNDQITFSGTISLDDIKPDFVFEQKKSDLVPRQVGLKVDYTKKTKIKLDIKNFELKAEDLVSRINKYLAKGYNGKKKVLGGTLSGIDMNNQIYLLSIGLQLNTSKVETNLGDSANLSNIGPVLVLSLIMDLKGEISLTTTVEYESTTNDDLLIGVKKDSIFDFTGDPFRKYVSALNPISSQGYNWFIDRHSKNLNKELSLEINTKAKGSVGLGVEAGLMVFGIMPLAANLSVQANGEGQYYLKGTYTNPPDKFSFDAEGEWKIDAGIYFQMMANLKYKIGGDDSKYSSKAKYELNERILKFFEENGYKSNEIEEIIGAIYDNEVEMNLVTENYNIELKNDKYSYKTKYENGQFKFNNVKTGKYTVKVTDINDDSVIYETEQDITSNSPNFNIYLNKTNDIPFAHTDTYISVKAGETLRYSTSIPLTMDVVSDKGTRVHVARFESDGRANHSYNAIIRPANFTDEDYYYQGDYAQMYISKNGYIELQILEGETRVYLTSNSKKLTVNEMIEYGTLEKLNRPVFLEYTINAGESIIVDNQYIGSRATDATIFAIGENVKGNEKFIDYYWNVLFGWEITETNEILDSPGKYTISLKEGKKLETSVTSGSLTYYVYYNDEYFNQNVVVTKK